MVGYHSGADFMFIDIYVLDGGTWRGQFAFSNWKGVDQNCFQLEKMST